MKPILLFGTQFTLSLVAYALLGLWYAVPRLSGRPRQAALQPLVWVHAFRMIGGTILAPGAVGAGVPLLFQRVIGLENRPVPAGGIRDLLRGALAASGITGGDTAVSRS